MARADRHVIGPVMGLAMNLATKHTIDTTRFGLHPFQMMPPILTLRHLELLYRGEMP
jgi:hypothetical protein